MKFESTNFPSPWARRDFLKASAAAALGLAFSRLPAMAGPFTREDFEQLVPADKKLDAAWVKSLFARGEPQVFRGDELDKIGMPVGGICAGQLYLGGDGRLWHWDIFNDAIHTGDAHYAKPMKPGSPLEQGFAVRVTAGGKSSVRKIERADWRDISFRGEYPVARVEYADPESPLSVSLEAFSPFIPLNTDDSSLPATVLEFTLKNFGAEKIEVELAGWLENAVCLHSAKSGSGERRNRIVRKKNFLVLECSASGDAQASDFGTMTLALLDAQKNDFGNANAALENVFADAEPSQSADVQFPQKLFGAFSRKLTLAPGATAKVSFVIAWHFPNLKVKGIADSGRFYATKFFSSFDVANYVAKNFERLAGETRLWRDTWYDSTLPFWFLDRTFLNASILASSTCYRFANGRFYGWEGVGCCAGTCAHVYHYAHSVARLFPEIERDLRERVDFGLAQQPDGAIHFRGECNKIPAIDAQAGTILRALREHQMSVDAGFLKRNWPKIKRATQWLIAKDADGDGIIEGNQHNTLDTDWFGPVAWLSGLYLAALVGAAAMADEIGDEEFALECRGIFEAGRKNLVTQLFDGEYFINKVDPKHLDAINSGTGCEIDQVFGQSWAFQVGLPRVLPKRETLSALRSLWRYNFSPDVGPYRAVNKSGRWYAMPGEAGLLMCSFPRADWDLAKAAGKGREVFVGYFNECMNGFEHQVAGHMIWEGMTLEGLAVERAVHDRYHASRRNPWNEIECGDHYARSMASHGVYLAACGFEHHGPKGHIGFAPKISPENFKCAFTSAEGWGAFSQKRAAQKMECGIAVRWGALRLKTIALEIAEGAKFSVVKSSVGMKSIHTTLAIEGQRALVTFAEEILLSPGKDLQLILT